MTNRKCGTCRFFEVSTSQTHGWCRNTGNPHRDDVALLRTIELGCRDGWAKDYWQPLDNAAVALAETNAPEVTPEQVTAVPIGTGIVPLVAPGRAKKPEIPAAAAPPLPPVRPRVGYQGAALTPIAAGNADGGQDVIVNYNAPLGSHPELNENGVPLPRPKRSAVAEAHKRALERREAERAAASQRRAAPPLVPATPSLGISPHHSQVGSMPAARTEESRADAILSPAAPPVAQPVPAQQTGLPSQPAADRSSAAPGPGEQTWPRRTTTADVPARPPIPNAAPGTRASEGEPEETPAAASEPLRYWDQQTPGNRFTRMRPEATEGAPERAEARAPQSVGRLRADAVPAPTRTIRSLSTAGGAMESPVTAREESRPPSQRLPRPAQTAGETQAPPEAMPREIDETLLRQLAADWRTQALDARAGQRCGTCRYFQSGDGGERGTCGCQFTPVHRQPVGAPDLACLSGLGTWWAPTDEGWLQKTEERRPRRATPLLDALEREAVVAAQLAQGNERRRGTR